MAKGGGRRVPQSLYIVVGLASLLVWGCWNSGTPPPDRRGHIWGVINGAVTRADGHPSPQLSETQMLWIAAGINQAISAHQTATVLIWGLGYDSRVWHNVNVGGRTIFLEYYSEWINTVLKELPSLEAYQVTYNATIALADSFFSAPWIVPLPPTVSELCYDVILVDAPEGGDPSKPGRMEASYWSLMNAERCVRSGQKKRAHIFLHDVNRQMEQRIITDIFLANGNVKELGLMKGPAGDLSGFLYSLS